MYTHAHTRAHTLTRGGSVVTGYTPTCLEKLRGDRMNRFIPAFLILRVRSDSGGFLIQPLTHQVISSWEVVFHSKAQVTNQA